MDLEPARKCVGTYVAKLRGCVLSARSPDVVVRNLTCSPFNETPWFETECLFIKNIWFGNEQAKTTNNLLIIIKK